MVIRTHIVYSSYFLWPLFLPANIGSIFALLWLGGFKTTPFSLLAVLTGVALASVLLTAPMIRFLTNAWEARLQEFRSRLNYDAMHAYLL